MNMTRFTLFTSSLFSMMMLLASCGNARNTSTEHDADPNQPGAIVAEQVQMVKITTDFGEIVLKLYNETPEHRDNFVKLVGEGFYDGVLFHRVINAFMIQGGDPNSKDAQPGQPLGTGGPDYTIQAEIVPGLFHKKGALAAARMGDQMNPERRSSGSQFYIVQGRVWTQEELDRMEQQRGQAFSPEQRQAYTTIGGTPHLDAGYTVFGEVVEGLEVVDMIAAVQTGPGDRPVQNVAMKIELLK
jgi:cyclophilin family peptidyl-prolyl cis-trans isomerase